MKRLLDLLKLRRYGVSFYGEPYAAYFLRERDAGTFRLCLLNWEPEVRGNNISIVKL